MVRRAVQPPPQDRPHLDDWVRSPIVEGGHRRRAQSQRCLVNGEHRALLACPCHDRQIGAAQRVQKPRLARHALPDPGVAADQDQRPLDHAAAEHPVQLPNARGSARVHVQFDFVQQDRPARLGVRGTPAPLRSRPLLDQREVSSRSGAIRTTARLRGGVPALLTAIDRTVFRHQLPPRLRLPTLL